MKIKYLVDYRGRETAMQEREKSDVEDLEFSRASELIRLGVVVEFDEKPKKEKVKYGENTQQTS